jgi:hypothetical protein
MELLTEKEFESIDFDDAKAFFVVRRSEDDLQTWIVAVTKVERSNHDNNDEKEYDYSVNSWIYHSPSRTIFPGAPWRSISNGETIVWVSIVPPPPLSSSSTIDRIQLESVDSEGFVKTWSLDLNDEEPRWSTDESQVGLLATGKKAVRRSSSRGNGVVALGESLSLLPTHGAIDETFLGSSYGRRVVDLERERLSIRILSRILSTSRVRVFLVPPLRFVRG